MATIRPKEERRITKTDSGYTVTGPRIYASDLQDGTAAAKLADREPYTTLQTTVGADSPLPNNPSPAYTAANGIRYNSKHPLGAKEIIERYNQTINSQPTRQESEGTRQAYERLRTYDDSEPVYNQSESVTAALERLRQAEAARPGAYNNQYRADIDDILDRLKNREAFDYNAQTDPMYIMSRDQALRAGQRAMMDTIGQAAGMSGGYGSSYAQAAGQQAYQDYLAGLNGSLGSLYDAAYQRYRDETGDLYNRLNALQGLENQDYSRYRDALNDYLTERNYQNTQYLDERNTDYDRFRDTMGDWQTDRNYWYNLYNNGRASDLEEYQTDLAQWQRDKDYWDELVKNLSIQYDLPMGMLLTEETAPEVVRFGDDGSEAALRQYMAWLNAQTGKTGSRESGKLPNAIGPKPFPGYTDVDAVTGADAPWRRGGRG